MAESEKITSLELVHLWFAYLHIVSLRECNENVLVLGHSIANSMAKPDSKTLPLIRSLFKGCALKKDPSRLFKESGDSCLLVL